MTRSQAVPIRICGLDEAGRGALAGPLVAAAVISNHTLSHIGKLAKTKVKDGKLLTDTQRRKIYSALYKLKTGIYIEVITARQINNHGIGWANKEIFRRLIRKTEADRYIVDGKLKVGRIRGKTHKVQSIVDADATIAQVILAGIVAKVERDDVMKKLHKEFPVYKWRRNAGYGTSAHIQMIQRHNICRYHRNIFVTTVFSKLNQQAI